MKFGYTIIYVTSVEKTVRFYETAFNLCCGFMHESKQYAELQTGETKLAFASDELGEINKLQYHKNSMDAVSPGVEIVLISDDVKKSYEVAIANGAYDLHPPIEKPWGQLVAYVRDLNGILIEICSPMG